MVQVMVAGAFVFASPSGFATVTVPASSGSGAPGSTNGGMSAPPVAIVAATPSQIMQQFITLDASNSFDPNGGALTFNWTSVGNLPPVIINGNTPTPIIEFAAQGNYAVQLTVTSSSGAMSSVTVPLNFLGSMQH